MGNVGNVGNAVSFVVSSEASRPDARGDAVSDASFLERVEELVDGHATEAIWQRHKREQDEQRGRAILRALIEDETPPEEKALAEEEAPLDEAPIDLPEIAEEELAATPEPEAPAPEAPAHEAPAPETSASESFLSVDAAPAKPAAVKPAAVKPAAVGARQTIAARSPEPTFLAFSASDVDSVMGGLFQEDSDESSSGAEQAEEVESSEETSTSEPDRSAETSGGILAGVASLLPESPEGWIKLGLGVVAGLGVLHLATRSMEPKTSDPDMFNESRFARHCGYCGAPDHDMRNCPARAARVPRLPPRKR